MATKLTPELLKEFSKKKNNIGLLNECNLIYHDLINDEIDRSLYYKKLVKEDYNVSTTHYSNPMRYNNLSHYYQKHSKFLDWSLFIKIEKLINQLNFRVKFEVAHVNITNIASEPVHHFDGTTPTILYYANPNWDIEWGGETWLLDEKEDVIDSVRYKSGRVVIFNGNRPHITRTPTHYAKCTNRLTLAVRFIFIDEKGNEIYQEIDPKYELKN